MTTNFAGVERYVTTVAAETVFRGWSVRVIGGRADEMRRLLPADVAWSPASSVGEAIVRLARQPSDVVHAHMTKAEVAALLTPRSHLTIATRHFAAVRGRNWLVSGATDLLARRLAAEIAISETVRTASGVPDMRVLLNAVPMTTLTRQPERTVVVAQRWEGEKRTADALAIFERTRLAHSGWRLVIYGAGTEESALRKAAAESSVASAIEIAGFSRDMPDVLSRAGIVLATASHEPFGLLVAEAMAAGVPVVASRAGGHLESVGMADGARLFPPGDIHTAADVLKELADLSPDAREAYGSQLRDWAVGHLSVGQHVDDLLDVYNAALRAPRNRRSRIRQSH